MADPSDMNDTSLSSKHFLGGRQIREIANDIGMRPTKTRGQNFVVDGNTVRKIVRLAKIGQQDTVLEVGPGLGSLTLGLLDASHRVLAVEIDEVLAKQLPRTIEKVRSEEAGNLALIHKDAMDFTREDLNSFEDIEPPTHFVANLPYNVAVPILLHILEEFPELESGLVMVQEEVGDRLVATSGDKIYGVPSVKAQWYGTMDKVSTVKKNVFWPVPKVSSALVSFKKRTEPLDASVEKKDVFAAIDSAFSQRRKTLRSSLASWFSASADRACSCDVDLEKIFVHAEVDSTLRAENLDIGDFIKIVRAKNELFSHTIIM